MFADRKFVFQPVLTIAAAISLAVLLSLGAWQLQRLEWKQDLIAKVDARAGGAPVPVSSFLPFSEDADIEYSPVQVTGRVADAAPIRVFGTLEGAAGYYAFLPVALDSGASIFVNFGFLKQDAWTDDIANEVKALGDVSLTGLLRRAAPASGLAATFAPSPDIEDRLWFHRDIAAMHAAYGAGDPLFYVDAQVEPGADWPKPGATRIEFSNRHFEYAMTWFGLAATLVGVWFAFSFPKKR